MIRYTTQTDTQRKMDEAGVAAAAAAAASPLLSFTFVNSVYARMKKKNVTSD